MTTAALSATIGHNNPPSDAETLKESLQEKHGKLLSRANELFTAADRIPEVFASDEEAQKAGDFIKQITACSKSLEAERVSEKEPYLTLGRVVDGFFKNYTDILLKAKNKASRPLDAYVKQKAEEERKQRQEEAERLRKQAEEQATAAAALSTAKMDDLADKALNQAVITEQQANKVEASIAAKPAELASVRGEMGSLASLRTRWVGEVIDRESLDIEKLRHHIPLDALQKALNSFITAGGRELKGAKIYEKTETVVR